MKGTEKQITWAENIQKTALAVSYTHLDVYKRQRCASSSLPIGGMGHGIKMSMTQEGLPSEQTGLRFASFSFN